GNLLRATPFADSPASPLPRSTASTQEGKQDRESDTLIHSCSNDEQLSPLVKIQPVHLGNIGPAPTLRGFADGVEVLAPASLRGEMAESAKRLGMTYAQRETCAGERPPG